MLDKGVHLHSYQTGQTEAQAFADLRAKGATVARVDTHWGQLQEGNISQTSVTSAATLLTMSAAAFASYMTLRGFVGWSLTSHYESLKNGIGTTAQADIGVIFNFGNLPASLTGQKPAWYTPPDNDWASLYPTDPAAVGKALHDFIIYAYRTAQAEGLNGLDLIKNVVGWQIFNEVTNDYSEYGPFGPNGVQGKPYYEYFDILKQTHTYVNQAYDALGIAAADRPSIIGPGHGGTFDDTNFWQSLQAYEAEKGVLPIDTLAFHPYGLTVRNWAADNKLYGRILAPTDDYLTWKAMAGRSATDDLAFGTAATDNEFNKNTEVGMERTLALLTQQGRSGFDVVFTEFGGSSYTGDPTKGFVNGINEALVDVAFVDPFKYGNFGYNSTSIASNTALNLQTEAVMQAVGLMEDWAFVTNATVFEYAQNPYASPGGYQSGFGLSAPNGTLKPAALAYYAYVAGNGFTGTPAAQPGTAGAWAGVNVHIDALVGKGATNVFTSTDTAAAPLHQLVLMRDGNDAVDVKFGDDIVFAGDGNDTVSGGAGFDRLYGGKGNDILNGGSEADKLKGGTGNDTMTGGTGADQFSLAVFTGVSGNSGSDTITDFSVAEDVLAITGGYSAANLIALAVNEAGGVRLRLGDSGATVLLQNVTKAQLTAANFYLLQVDNSIVTVGSTTVTNVAGTAQYLSGSTNIDTFVINASSTLYSWGETEDGQGTVVYRGTDFDILNHSPWQFERIQFTDRVVDLVAEPQSGGSTGGSGINGTAGNDTLNGTAAADTINGLDGADLLYGLAGNDTLNGGLGNDVLYGGAGADRHDGGDGTDRASYIDATAGIWVELDDPSLNSGIAAGDSYVSIENLEGTQYNDTIWGNASGNGLYGNNGNDSIGGLGGADTFYGQNGNDTMLGGLDNDVLYGGAGADLHDGGDGTDRATYLDATSGLTVSLTTPATNTGIAAGDTYVGIEDLQGSAYADNLTGNAVANRIWGNNGNDTIRAGDGNDALYGGAGVDFLDGGAGTDLASYSDSTAGVTVNLTNPATNTGWAAGDSFTAIENLQGSQYADTVIGNASANVLYGHTGNDSIYGDGGNDTVYGDAGDDLVFGDAGNDWVEGGAGNDWNVGGTGADIFAFRTGFGQEGIGDFDIVADVIRFYGLGVSTFAQLQPLMTNTAAGTLIDFGGGNSVMVHGVALANLAANDFWFG